MALFAERGPWLFSRRIDLWTFGGSALASWLLVALGVPLGLLDRDAPAWTFLLCVLAIDVAHVWSTGYRVYFDRHERASSPLLYIGVPLLAYGVGLALHAFSALTFWRALAYLALFHFVRQQAGFMRLYARRTPAQTKLDDVLDQGAIYMSMLYPVLHWHAHLPRAFQWFVQGDFVSDPWVAEASSAALPFAQGACIAFVAGFAVRQLALGRHAVPGKSILLVATLSCWVLGIVVFDSDYVFTVTNVIIHGVPYFVLTHRYADGNDRPSLARTIVTRGVLPFVGVCVALATIEEALWDSFVWNEHLGRNTPLAPGILVFVVPLLAVPQVTHYVLDGFVWRMRRLSPVLRRELELR